MNGIKTSGEGSEYYRHRETTAYDHERFEPTTAAPGNLAAAMKNGPIRIPRTFHPLKIIPISNLIPISEDAQKRAKNENVVTD
ncbi:MAG: hypothetical protein OXG88_07500 [Gammaproteobacteria bacterium]|nr:hypothetical protein [Gammaproteobacteria bacterium]